MQGVLLKYRTVASVVRLFKNNRANFKSKLKSRTNKSFQTKKKYSSEKCKRKLQCNSRRNIAASSECRKYFCFMPTVKSDFWFWIYIKSVCSIPEARMFPRECVILLNLWGWTFINTFSWINWCELFYAQRLMMRTEWVAVKRTVWPLRLKHLAIFAAMTRWGIIGFAFRNPITVIDDESLTEH